MAGTLQASESWHQVKLRHSTGTCTCARVLFAQKEIAFTSFAFRSIQNNICIFKSFPEYLVSKKFFPNIKQVNYTCSKNTGAKFFMESSRGWLEAQGGARVQRSPRPRRPGLGTGGSPGQTLPVALKHEEQPHGGGGVTVMTAPNRLSGQRSCASWRPWARPRGWLTGPFTRATAAGGPRHTALSFETNTYN